MLAPIKWNKHNTDTIHVTFAVDSTILNHSSWHLSIKASRRRTSTSLCHKKKLHMLPIKTGGNLSRSLPVNSERRTLEHSAIPFTHFMWCHRFMNDVHLFTCNNDLNRLSDPHIVINSEQTNHSHWLQQSLDMRFDILCNCSYISDITIDSSQGLHSQIAMHVTQCITHRFVANNNNNNKMHCPNFIITLKSLTDFFFSSSLSSLCFFFFSWQFDFFVQPSYILNDKWTKRSAHWTAAK